MVDLALLVAVGVNEGGYREVLAVEPAGGERKEAWRNLLKGLLERGLQGVRLVISDDHPSIRQAVMAELPGARWQRCVVHQVRASLSQVRSQDRALLAQDLRGVYMAGSRKEALEALGKLRAAWGSRYPSLVVPWWEGSGALLRFYEYPQVLWPYLRSTNLMERFIREIRRGTKVRDHKFPRPESVYKLLYVEGERQEGRWAERRLKGFAEAQEILERMLLERYTPQTQTLTHKS